MIVECPAEIFKQLEDGCGGYVDLSGEVGTFVYSALGNGTWLGDSDMSWCEEIECEHKIKVQLAAPSELPRQRASR